MKEGRTAVPFGPFSRMRLSSKPSRSCASHGSASSPVKARKSRTTIKSAFPTSFWCGPLLPSQDVITLWQYKHGARSYGLTFPAGELTGDEPIEAAARRELMEETGYRASEVQVLGKYAVNGNQGCGNAYLCTAKGCVRVAEPRSGDLEHMDLKLMSIADVDAAVRGGVHLCAPASCSLGQRSRLTSCDTTSAASDPLRSADAGPSRAGTCGTIPAWSCACRGSKKQAIGHGGISRNRLRFHFVWGRCAGFFADAVLVRSTYRS